MSDVSHQNPNFHLSNKPPHKHGLNKTKPTKRSPRSNKNKIINNKPLKVVYISNPMKFEATPTEFRALVQELTGRDAVVDWSDDYEDTVAAAAGGGGGGGDDGSSDGGVTHDQVVVQELMMHQDYDNNNYQNEEADADVTSFSACFEPSDHHHHLISFDCFGPFHHGDDEDGMEDFRAFMDDH